MSQSATEPITPATQTTAATIPTASTTTTATTTTTPAQAEIDWKAEARKWETRAKENTGAAERLAAIEEANKTEAQKLADRATAAETKANDSAAEALRWRIAAKHGITDADAETFLTGKDETTLTAQAERLSELAKATGTTPKPDLTQGARGATAATGDPAQDFATFLKAKLGS
jgi:hypothetical protein